MKNRETDEWLTQNEKSTKNFIRKWGHFCSHDALMKPKIPPKYDIAFVIKNCKENILKALEPWCSTIYVDCDIDSYIEKEQENTSIDLKKRIYPISIGVNNNIEVHIDGFRLTNEDFGIIQQLSEILQDSGDIGSFNIGALEIIVNSMQTYENNLIIN